MFVFILYGSSGNPVFRKIVFLMENYVSINYLPCSWKEIWIYCFVPHTGIINSIDTVGVLW